MAFWHQFAILLGHRGTPDINGRHFFIIWELIGLIKKSSLGLQFRQTQKSVFDNISSLTIATTFAKYFDKLSKKMSSLSSHLVENSCYEINL